MGCRRQARLGHNMAGWKRDLAFVKGKRGMGEVCEAKDTKLGAKLRSRQISVTRHLLLAAILRQGGHEQATEFYRAPGKCHRDGDYDPGRGHHPPRYRIRLVADHRLSRHVLQRLSPARGRGRDCAGLPAVLPLVERASAASSAHRLGRRLSFASPSRRWIPLVFWFSNRGTAHRYGR